MGEAPSEVVGADPEEAEQESGPIKVKTKRTFHPQWKMKGKSEISRDNMGTKFQH